MMVESSFQPQPHDELQVGKRSERKSRFERRVGNQVEFVHKGTLLCTQVTYIVCCGSSV